MTDTLIARRKFQRWTLLVLMLVSVLLLFRCGEQQGQWSEPPSPYPPLAYEGQYPTTTSNLYFAKPYNSYDEYVGLPGFPLHRADAHWLGNMSGFEFYQSHQGGYGDTLEVVSYENGIYFCWAYNLLMEVSLFEGWQGQVEEEKNQLTGIRLGSTAGDFLAKYPSATVGELQWWNGYGGNSYRVSFEYGLWPDYINTRNLTADCDANDIIRRLRVDPFDVDYFGFVGPK